MNPNHVSACMQGLEFNIVAVIDGRRTNPPIGTAEQVVRNRLCDVKDRRLDAREMSLRPAIDDSRQVSRTVNDGGTLDS
jgi:hypothetical protein